MASLGNRVLRFFGTPRCLRTWKVYLGMIQLVLLLCLKQKMP